MNTIAFGWDNPEKTILHLILRDGWAWPDFYAVNNEIEALICTRSQPVHLLVDHSQTRTLPTGGVVTYLRNILGAYPPNCGLYIVVTNNMMVQRLVSTFQTANQSHQGRRVYIASTPDDAYRLIEQHAPATMPV